MTNEWPEFTYIPHTTMASGPTAPFDMHAFRAAIATIESVPQPVSCIVCTEAYLAALRERFAPLTTDEVSRLAGCPLVAMPTFAEAERLAAKLRGEGRKVLLAF